MDWTALATKEQRFAIGLTSGPSCTGVQASLVRVKGTGEQLAIKHVHTIARPYASGYRIRLLSPKIDARETALLSFELGIRFAEAAQELIEYAEKQGIAVDFIASGGHSIAHIPPRPNEAHYGTLDIAEPAIIAERCGLTVVSDFRARDIAAGGQGSPLASYAYANLFRREDRTTVCVDLGGIASLIVVPPVLEEMQAFDVGPGMITVDGPVRFLTGGTREIDEDGALAAKGIVIDEFLEYLLDHPYFQRVPPKSTSLAEFGPDAYLRDAIASRGDQSLEDMVATCNAAVAYSIIRAYNRFVRPHQDVDRLVILGGGSQNRTLVEHLKKGLNDVIFRTAEDYGLPWNALSCMTVAILGNEAICRTRASVPQATGAKHAVILGKITPHY